MIARPVYHNRAILMDDADPEALAEMCAKLNRWEFMFVVLPVLVPGGIGAPVNPLAIFQVPTSKRTRGRRRGNTQMEITQ